jgi:hypothetical protein
MNDDPPPLLYPFRFVDPVTGRWVRARYRASLDDLAVRYERWEIIGEPEARYVVSEGFSPFSIAVGDLRGE